jgi:ankyrin repeat protein
MMATIHGHIAIVKMLLDHGADVHAQNNRGMTALMYAAWNKHAAIVQTLLAHGARLDTKDQDGWTALQYAKDTRLQSSTQTGSAAIVALLQKAKVRRQLLHLAPPESQQIGSIDLRDRHSGRIY